MTRPTDTRGPFAGERRGFITAPNDCWSLRLMPARLFGGEDVRLLLIVDDYTGHSPGMAVNDRFASWDIVEGLNDAARRCGLPRRLRLNGDPEFHAAELSVWAQVHQIRLLRPNPGSEAISPAMASFRDKVRQDCLNQERLVSLAEAQQTIDAWRRRFNGEGDGELECGSAGRPDRDAEASAQAQRQDGPQATFQIDWPASRVRG